MNTKEEARKWIEDGGVCVYRCGFGWKGAQKTPITKENALELLPKYDFTDGPTFYELIFNGRELIFNEFTANDMW